MPKTTEQLEHESNGSCIFLAGLGFGICWLVFLERRCARTATTAVVRRVPILRKTEQIIKYFEPKLWFMENPQTGKMKDFVDTSTNFYDVDYCKYSDWGYRKRTRIWTNKTDFIPKVCHKDCGYVKDNRHIMNVTGSAKGRRNLGQGGGNNRAPRYKIPAALITELLT